MILHHDHFQNYKRYNIPKAQLIIADIPFNIGENAYGSNPQWYVDGDNKKGESEFAGKQFFDTDKNFNIAEFMHFVNTMLKKEPKERNQAGCMIVFCEFEQQFMLIEQGKKYGFPNYINLVFRKNYSAQVLKANMRVVGNCEYAVILYRDKLPKFNNDGKMVFNCMDHVRDTTTPKIHPTQKSIHTLKRLIEVFTDIGDVVIDPCAGSGVALLAAELLGRRPYGFEIKKEYVEGFRTRLARCAIRAKNKTTKRKISKDGWSERDVRCKRGPIRLSAHALERWRLRVSLNARKAQVADRIKRRIAVELKIGAEVNRHGALKIKVQPEVWAVCFPSLMGGWEVATIIREGWGEEMEEQAKYGELKELLPVVARAKIVKSVMKYGAHSLRNRDGGDVRAELGKFQEGDEVVIIPEAVYEKLIAGGGQA